VAGGLDQTLVASLTKLTEAVNSKPSDAAAWESLGRAYEAARVPAGAQVAFGAAAELNPKNPKLWYRAAITAGRLGEVELALERLANVLGLAPDYGPAWRRKGTWLLDLGRAAEALPAFERASELMPEKSDAIIGLARVALAEDRVEDALGLTQLALERAPGDPYVRSLLGNALRRSGQSEAAVPHMVAGQNSTPLYSDPWSEEAARSRRKEEDAIQRIEQLQEEGRFDESIELVRKAIRESPTSSKLPLRLGVALMRAGRYEEAVAHYDAAVLKFPGSYELAAGRAAALNTTGKLSAALKAADHLIARWPDRSVAYLQRGAALEKMGDVPAARAAFQRASQLQPSDLRGPLFEGRMLAKLKRFQEAKEVLERALELPGAAPPLTYFRILLAVQASTGAGPASVKATVERARLIHGDEADTLLR
jgi:tetratricopeptide (TPR) repeat protein